MKIQLLSVFEGKKKIWKIKLTIFKIIPMSFLPKHQMLLEKKNICHNLLSGNCAWLFNRDKESDVKEWGKWQILFQINSDFIFKKVLVKTTRIIALIHVKILFIGNYKDTL